MKSTTIKDFDVEKLWSFDETTVCESANVN